MAFGGVSVRRVLTDSIDALEIRCSNAFSSVRDAMRDMTTCGQVLMGRAAASNGSKLWPFLHHRFAHGKLKWLSIDGRTRDLLGAMGALVDADVYESVEEMCTAALPSPAEFEKVTAPRVLEVVMQAFWNTAYARWIVGITPKIEDRLSKACSTWGTRFSLRPRMTLEDVINEKIKYSNVTRTNFGEHSSAQLMSKEFIRNMNVRRQSLQTGKTQEELKDFNPSLPPARSNRPSDDAPIS